MNLTIRLSADESLGADRRGLFLLGYTTSNFFMYIGKLCD
jgi:hypothetical protein